MKKITLSYRVMVLLICLCVLLSTSNWLAAIAMTGSYNSNYCEHHSKHTEDCGYGEGHPCEFVCEICGYTIARWQWVDPNGTLMPGDLYDGFDDVDWVLDAASLDEDLLLSILPSRINAELKNGEHTTLTVTWDTALPEPYQLPDQMPVDGELPDFYLFNAALPEGYSLAEGVEKLSVLVRLTDIMPLAETMPLADTEDDDWQLLASLDFNDSTNRLKDTSENNVQANLVNGNNNYKTEADGNTYLDLTGNNAYLSLPAGITADLIGLTVEMRIQWSLSNAGNGSNWAFYGATNGNVPWPGNYVAVAFNESDTQNKITAQRQQGTSNDRSNLRADWPTDNAWHKVKVVFDEDTTYIYIDDTLSDKLSTSYRLADCLSTSGVLWFGAAAWNGSWGNPGEFFKGSIDDIKLWGKTPPPPPPMIAENYIVTDGVVDPEDTVVNFFDYWTNRGQYDSDFQAMHGFSDVLNGINGNRTDGNHVLLFAGYFGLTGDNDGGTEPNNGRSSGNWNAWTGDSGSDGLDDAWDFSGFDAEDERNPRYKPYQGIVAKTLDENGYPQLDLADHPDPTGRPQNWGQPPVLDPIWAPIVNGNRQLRTESLQYLFDPTVTHYGKASYPNAKGLFRMNDDGYYYYNSKESYAELNADQPWGAKNSKKVIDEYGKEIDQNQVTLFNTPWQYGGNSISNSGAGSATAADNAAREKYERGELDQGQFFPFNHWADLFTPVTDKKVSQNHYLLETQAYAGQPMNHYFGMTVTTKFQQPRDGKISPSTDMTFEFSGDDDVWIFIDDVLVGDIGGIHLPDGISINFSTGDIKYTALNAPAQDKTITHMNKTIKQAFIDALGATEANKLSWNGNTFANGSIHTLKFYYMERGNDVSNCSISFNLEPILKDRIRKVNEDGDSLDNAMFELYEAAPSNYNNDTVWHTADEFAMGSLVAGDLRSDGKGNGYYELVDANKDAIDFTKYADDSYFILYEKDTPPGYRLNKNIVLQYHHATNTFTVINKYETGAYASFVAKWTQHDAAVNYAVYNPSNGKITKGAQINERIGNTYNNTTLKNGLAVVVPVFKQTTDLNTDGAFQRWLPMYGSNTLGWHTITKSYQSDMAADNDGVMFVRDLALAAFLQITETSYRDWYLTWDEKTNRLTGDLENLPGDATRYVVNNSTDPDLNLVTLFINGDELENLLGESLSFESAKERYDALKTALSSQIEIKRRQLGGNATDEEVVKAILDDVISGAADQSVDPFRLLYTDEFSRVYRTALYVPNERRELRVRKVDGNTSDGTIYINGAVFAIFDNPSDAKKFPKGNVEYSSKAAALAALTEAQQNGGSGIRSFGETATVKLNTSVNGYQEGLLVFREDDGHDGDGYAHITWPHDRDNANPNETVLWLKEIYSPDGYARNKNLVRIEVGNQSIYANATGYDENGNILNEAYAKKADGIRVYAALGKLSQTLVKYAFNNHVDITLRDITITLQKAGTTANGGLDHIWRDASKDPKDTYELHYGLYSDVLTSQYGQHTYDEQLPLFTATDDYIRIMPRQNQRSFKNAGDDLHSYNAKMDILTDTGESEPREPDGKPPVPIDLDGLFGLMNIVEVTNNVIPISLMISKEVVGPKVPNDIFSFAIKLAPTTESGKWNSPNEVAGEYHAYLHPTGHQVLVYDQHRNPVPEINPSTGEPVKDANGQTVYKTRPCGPADHTNDEVHLHLVVDEAGNGLVKDVNNPNSEYSVLQLKDGETFAIVGLPPGAKFGVTEIILPPDAQYDTTIERTNDMRPYGDGSDYDYNGTNKPNRESTDPDKNPEITITSGGRTVLGFLQSASYAWDMKESPDYANPFPTDQREINDIVVPPAEVKFINTGIADLPDTGGSGNTLYWLAGIAFLIAASLIFISEIRRKNTSN